MDVCFEFPFKFGLEITEVDDRTLAMGIHFKISFESFFCVSSYKGHAWIEYSSWDDFIQKLGTNYATHAILKDMSGNFRMSLLQKSKCHELRLSFSVQENYENRSTISEYAACIDCETYKSIRSRFVDFPRWW